MARDLRQTIGNNQGTKVNDLFKPTPGTAPYTMPSDNLKIQIKLPDGFKIDSGNKPDVKPSPAPEPKTAPADGPVLSYENKKKTIRVDTLLVAKTQ